MLTPFPTQEGIVVRWMIQSDYCNVIDIENDCEVYAPGFIAWNLDDLRGHLRKSNRIGVVCTSGSIAKEHGFLGYMTYELHKSTLLITKFATHSSHRRTGVASRMISRMIERLSQQRRSKCVCFIPEENLAAQLTLSKLGFIGEFDHKYKEIKFTYRHEWSHQC